MTRIIKADRPARTRMVPGAVLDARAQAREIIEAARIEGQALRERAREQGRQEGRAELAAAELRLARNAQAALDALEPEALKVALEVARRVVDAELSSRPEAIAELVARLMRRVRRAQRVGLHLHPDDLSTVKAALDGLMPDGCEAAVELVPDATLERGDCVLRSDVGTLDGRVQARIDALARALGAV